MSYILKDLPKDERPRERMIKYGASSLSLQELLAIIIRTGTHGNNALELSNLLLANYQRLDLLNETTVKELTSIKGIGEAKAVQLLAAIELGKRINTPSKINYRIVSPKDTYIYLKNQMQHLSQEELYCLYLNGKGEIVDEKMISRGTINQTQFHPRDIFKWAVKSSAVGLIIAHNHPSGDPLPSPEDINVTKTILKVSEIFEIKFLDHIVIGKKGYYSFSANKLVF